MQHLLAVMNSSSLILNSESVSFVCGDIKEAETLDPFTHVYMYDVAFEPNLMESIANMFNNRYYCCLLSTSTFLVSNLNLVFMLSFWFHIKNKT
jgi:hypothetical protein